MCSVSPFFALSIQSCKVNMSGTALRDLNVLPLTELEKLHESSAKGNITKHYIWNGNESIDKSQSKNPPSVTSSPLNEVNAAVNGSEVGNSEIEYIESENLTDLSDVDSSLTVRLNIRFLISSFKSRAIYMYISLQNFSFVYLFLLNLKFHLCPSKT